MTHETARRTVSRFWLVAFAGIVAAGGLSARARDLPVRVQLPGASFAAAGAANRRPVSAFATAAGVYELDLALKKIRVWPRTARGSEIGAGFDGVDGAGNGVKFSNPKRMAKRAGSNLVAVVDASVANENLGLVPGVSFYEFSETVDEAGELKRVDFVFKGRFEHPLFRYAEDAAFAPAGSAFDVAVAATYENVASVDGEARQSWIVFGTGVESPVLTDAVFAVRDKAAYTNTEPVVSWPTTLAVDPDGSTVWAGSRSMASVLRYDGPGGDYVTPVVRWTWVYELDGGPTGHSGGGHYEPAVDPNPCAVADSVVGELDEAGSVKSRIGRPGGLRIWDAGAAGKLLVVADTDNHRVVAFDEGGVERFRFGEKGSRAGQFTNPADVWVNDDGTEIVVADTGNGRVQVFSLLDEAGDPVDVGPDPTVWLEGFTTVVWEDGARTVARTNAVFHWESDYDPVTNWLVAAAAWSTDRTFAVSAESSAPGAVRLAADAVVLPAGETRVPVVFHALDGVADGTLCTIRVGDLEGTFAISNAPPSLRTGNESSIGAAFDSGSFAWAEEAVAEDSASGSEFGIRLVGRQVHFHAKAFDVAADGPLEYEWHVIGTKSGVLTVDRTWYTNVVETGIPPTRTVVRLPEAEALLLPEGPNGGRLLVSTNEILSVTTEYVKTLGSNVYEPRLVTNAWELVVTTNELFATTVRTTYRNEADWAHLFFDGSDVDGFIHENVTLAGADAVFDTDTNVLYFAILTVTDKDGASVRTLDTVNETYWCFKSLERRDPAAYAAVFTDVSGTNFAFRLSVTNGIPTEDDWVSVQYASLLAGPWNLLYPLNAGSNIVKNASASGEPVVFETGEAARADFVPDSVAFTLDAAFFYETEPASSTRFYRVVQP